MVDSDAPICSRCKAAPTRPGQRYCAPCHTEYMRGWRARRRQFTKRFSCDLLFVDGGVITNFRRLPLTDAKTGEVHYIGPELEPREGGGYWLRKPAG